jgi:hypothetical protein
MNTEQEIHQAFADFQSGVLGGCMTDSSPQTGRELACQREHRRDLTDTQRRLHRRQASVYNLFPVFRFHAIFPSFALLASRLDAPIYR